MDVPLYTTPFVWVMNKDKYDGMSAAQKKLIDEHCTTEWAEKVASPWADFEFGGRAKLAGQAGHESYKLTASSSTPGARQSHQRRQRGPRARAKPATSRSR